MYIVGFASFLTLVWYPVAIYIYFSRYKLLKPINLLITFIYLLVCWYVVIGDLELRLQERLTIFFIPLVGYTFLMKIFNKFSLPQKIAPHFMWKIMFIAILLATVSGLTITGIVMFTNWEI